MSWRKRAVSSPLELPERETKFEGLCFARNEKWGIVSLKKPDEKIIEEAVLLFHCHANDFWKHDSFNEKANKPEGPGGR